MEEFNLIPRSDRVPEESGLSAEEEAALRQKLFQLLSRRVRLYTMGDSSSVPLGTAEELLDSLWFTLDRYRSDRGLSLKYLAAADLEAMFSQALEETEKKIELGKTLYRAACAGVPDIENLSLFDTLENIGVFFKRYDPHFFAHQIPCDMDYQLCRAVPDAFRGIEYINEYLRRLILEDEFLRCFEKEKVLCLLSACCPDYRGLLINLFDPVFTNALGLILSGGDWTALCITPADRARLFKLFASLPRLKAQEALGRAAVTLFRRTGLCGPAAQDYFQKTAADLYPRIGAALSGGDLDGIFLPF